MSATRTFLIDTDTGSDDAVAIIMALRTPDIHVAAITVVAGNIPLAASHQQRVVYRRTLRLRCSCFRRRQPSS